MVLFQGADAIYWFWITTIITVLTIAGTWYFVITGRDRKPTRQRRGEETIERYGTIEEDRAPLSKFLIWTYVLVGIWAIVYVIWTGTLGIGW